MMMIININQVKFSENEGSGVQSWGHQIKQT